LNTFVINFFNLIHNNFPKPAFVKGLGDGAMIVQEFGPKEPKPSKLLGETLKTIERVDDEFAALCKNFSQSVRHAAPLRLGWSIVQGAVKKLDHEYVGSTLNKCARLCDAARPFGIVIDRQDFQEWPVTKRHQFFPQ